MKKIFLAVFILIGLSCFAQPSGYTKRNTKERLRSLILDSTLHIPYGTTPSLRGGWSGPWALFGNTTDSSLYRWSGTNWAKIGSGTVTSFSAGDLSPLFTTSEATVTTTPALSFSLTNASPFTVFGRATGTGVPSYLSLDTTFITNNYLKVRGLLSAGTGISYNSTMGVITNSGETGVITASNGLTRATNDIKLGGTLTGNTSIVAGSNTLTISTSTSSVNPFAVTSTTGNAISATAVGGSGAAIYGNNTSGYGLYGDVTSGIALQGNATSGISGSFFSNPSSTNTTVPVIYIKRGSSGTAANNIAGSVEFDVKTSGTSTALNIANEIIAKWTTADYDTRVSSLTLRGNNAGTAKDLATFSSNAGLILNGSLGLPYTAQTGTYSILATDYFVDATSGTFTITLPTAVGITGRIYVIKNSGAGTITIATTSSQTIDGVTTQTLSTQYSSYTVISDGANWKIM